MLVVYNRSFSTFTHNCVATSDLTSWRIYGESIINTSHFQVSQMYADINVKCVNFVQFQTKPKCGDKR